jgi:hypothetical protein
MEDQSFGALQPAIEALFPGQRCNLVPLPGERPWSRAFVGELSSGRRVFLKGTPRELPEPATTARLAQVCPELVPAVLHDDLIPEEAWRWFILADAGDCERLTASLEQACQAAYALALLQRSVQHDTLLRALLPSCVPEQLYQIVCDTCVWIERHSNVESAAEPKRMSEAVHQLKPVFEALATQLAALPVTCVHGDFWPGNLAIAGDRVQIIDWGEAVWGVGGASIWNLMYSSAGALAHGTASIWEAYSQG